MESMVRKEKRNVHVFVVEEIRNHYREFRKGVPVMKSRVKWVSLLSALVIVAAIVCSRAYWIPEGVPICTAASNQAYPCIATDAAGGAIIAWIDDRSGYHVYAQRINADGDVQWTVDGIDLGECSVSYFYDSHCQITQDGGGGAIVVWADKRYGSGHYYDDIFGQRINGAGAIQWAAGGVNLSNYWSYYGSAGNPVIASDGSGGAVYAWVEGNSDVSEVRSGRVNTSGTVLWNRVLVSYDDSYDPQIVSDGLGGGIIAFADTAIQYWDYRVYASRVDASGATVWSYPRAVCSATGCTYTQEDPLLVSDGAGGAVVSWWEGRGGCPFAQHLDAVGSPTWTPAGVAIAGSYSGYDHAVASDGLGGIIVTWVNSSSGTERVRAQRVNASGNVLWDPNGIAICSHSGRESMPSIVADGVGGAIVAWDDYRSGTSDIYAQRVDAGGSLLWATDGVPICTVPSTHERGSHLVSDTHKGAIACWLDTRNGQYNDDIYAQRVDSTGRILYWPGTIHAVRDVPGDEGRWVNVSWDASEKDYRGGPVTQYSIWRSLTGGQSEAFLGSGNAISSVGGMDENGPIKSAVEPESAGSMDYSWELLATQQANGFSGYAKIVRTMADSSASGINYHHFQIIAHTADPAVYYVSAPDSGYSVDNLTPDAPEGLTGEQSSSPMGLRLSWNPSNAQDLSHYAVYRDLRADFIPSAENLIASTEEATCFDADWRRESGYYYKVSAVDLNGNESAFALLRPDDVTGNDTPKAPEASYLSQNYPNPFNPTTRIAFGLARPASVSLRIYDTAGRLVRTMAKGSRPAGHYVEIWDGRGVRGEQVASGVYLYRLDAAAFTQTRKMILLR
jgi:hypothetical protein